MTHQLNHDIMSLNTRCEIAEGVAYSKDLDFLPDDVRNLICELIHTHLNLNFGKPVDD